MYLFMDAARAETLFEIPDLRFLLHLHLLANLAIMDMLSVGIYEMAMDRIGLASCLHIPRLRK